MSACATSTLLLANRASPPRGEAKSSIRRIFPMDLRRKSSRSSLYDTMLCRSCRSPPRCHTWRQASISAADRVCGARLHCTQEIAGSQSCSHPARSITQPSAQVNPQRIRRTSLALSGLAPNTSPSTPPALHHHHQATPPHPLHYRNHEDLFRSHRHPCLGSRQHGPRTVRPAIQR